MNILFFNVEDGSRMCSLPRIHFLDELKREGHDLSIFNPCSYSDFDEANEAFINVIKKAEIKYDLIVNYSGDLQFYEETILQINALGVPSLLICFDNLQVPFIHKKIAPHFDLVWLTSFETMPIFQKWGCKCLFLPYAANPYIFRPSFTREINAVGFIGTPYGTRLNKINDLLKHDVICELYSDNVLAHNVCTNAKKKRKIKIVPEDGEFIKFAIGRKILWSKVKKKIFTQPKDLLISKNLRLYSSVSLEEMNQLYSNFSLSLGITELWDTYVLKYPIHKLHMRTFEIPMSGGLQFAPYVKELSEYFDDEKEIVMYKSEEEYIDKAKYYLQDRLFQKRMKMKQSARSRAEKEHTWVVRFNKIFEVMGL